MSGSVKDNFATTQTGILLPGSSIPKDNTWEPGVNGQSTRVLIKNDNNQTVTISGGVFTVFSPEGIAGIMSLIYNYKVGMVGSSVNLSNNQIILKTLGPVSVTPSLILTDINGSSSTPIFGTFITTPLFGWSWNINPIMGVDIFMISSMEFRFTASGSDGPAGFTSQELISIFSGNMGGGGTEIIINGQIENTCGY